MRIIASASAKRSGALPNVPTLAELGFGAGDVSPWWGVVVPAGTPRPIVDRLAGWFNQITSEQDTKEFLARTAFDPLPGSPEQMQDLLQDRLRALEGLRRARQDPTAEQFGVRVTNSFSRTQKPSRGPDPELHSHRCRGSLGAA